MGTSTPPYANTDRTATMGFRPNAIDWVALVLMIVGATYHQMGKPTNTAS